MDDTVWAFSENARDTFHDMYTKYRFDRYFDSFEHYYILYTKRNAELWEDYGRGIITKEQLNEIRFSFPFILSNGFRELQEQKMRSANVTQYFKQIILSEDIGVHKPFPEIFHFAMSATQSEPNTSLMIGDNWANDVEGARNVGMGHVYYNINGEKELPFRPTFVLNDWAEISQWL